MNPTIRSRTGLFLSYRDTRATSTRFSRSRGAYDDDYDEEHGLISGTSHHAVDVDLPPTWSAFSLLLFLSALMSHQGRYLGAGRTNSRRYPVEKSVPFSPLASGNSFPTVTALEKLHAKHVLPGFTDRSHEEQEIEMYTTDITKVR